MNAQQLKNSILQMAVQGKLVPQNPNDEPASVLLEHIREEKAAMVKAGKIKKEKNPSVIFRGEDNLFYEQVGKDKPVCIADELPFEIPDSWEWVRLGSVSNYDGKKQKINAAEANPSLWGLDLEDIEKGGRLLAKKSVGERKAVGDKTIFHAGDILYSKLRPYLLKILVAPADGICTSEIVPFSVYGEINAEYVVCYLKSPTVDFFINSITYGIKMPRVGTSTMTNLLVPIPPINEQRRIVTMLQRLLPYVEKYNIAEIATSKLNASFPTQLKKSILQQAVQGKLVPQDPNDEPASVLLERIRKEKERLIKEGKIKRDKHESIIYRRDNSHYETVDGAERCIDEEIPFEIPESWEWVRLSSIASVLGGKRIPAGRRLSQNKTEHIYIRVSDMKDHSIKIDSLMYVPDDIYPLISRYIIQKEDIYITVAGTIGSVGIIPPELDGANLTENADRLVFSITNQRWLVYYLCSPFVQNQIAEATTKVGQPKLAIKRIENFLIALPPLVEQQRIVEKINGLSPMLKRL